jgi:hypothetical protein
MRNDTLDDNPEERMGDGFVIRCGAERGDFGRMRKGVENHFSVTRNEGRMKRWQCQIQSKRK